MNFFELQHRARRRTWLLVFYFVLAVILIIAAVNAVFYVVHAASAVPAPTPQEWLFGPGAYWQWIALLILALIGAGTLNTTLKLRGGGRAVAALVGARRIDPATKDLNERRLVNVVEEMSIASGTPVPALYVMDDESGINAFVAGLRPTEAVLVVTRGALENFNRDELQGVIAHEYSHIFNGDMRLNVRLMGVLAGILLIGQLGRVIMRSGGRSGGRNGGQAALIGLAIFVIGYIGLFFGALIKAAVSRQREFLADASSVQFTRNPDGIAGALWKIKEHVEGSRLRNSHADDLSHFCFGESVGAGFTSLMATHPPLDRRIRAIAPDYEAQRRMEHIKSKAVPSAATDAASKAGPLPGIGAGLGAAAVAAVALQAQQVSDAVGRISAAHADYAQKLHASIPQPLLERLHEPEGARETVYGLLLSVQAAAERAAGRAMIEAAESAAVADRALAAAAELAALGPAARLPLLNMSMPALKSLDWEARARLLAAAEDIVKSDGRFTTTEFALVCILREHLAEDAENAAEPKYFRYEQVIDEIRLLLSVLARTGAESEEAAAATYRHVMTQFRRPPGDPASLKECSLAALTAALEKLNRLAPLLKKSVIESCADCVIHDGKVLPREAELLQAVALCLDCPLPPLAAVSS
jgi:Zn-dependent protease with chaperone function